MKCIGGFKILICTIPSLLWLYTRDGRKFCEKSYLMPWESKPDRLAASLKAVLHVCSISMFILNRSSSFENESPKVPVWFLTSDGSTRQKTGTTICPYLFLLSRILTSSFKHHLEEAYPSEKMTIEIFDPSIALESDGEISSPLLSLSSMQVTIFFRHKAALRWLIKLWRTSSPLKLRKTSYLYEESYWSMMKKKPSVTPVDEILDQKI